MNEKQLLFEAWRIRDVAAEEAVLCGMIRYPDVTIPAVVARGLTAGDFSQHRSATIFDIACYCAVPAGDRPILMDVYDEVQRRRLRDDFGGPDFSPWLASVWFCTYWPADIAVWWEDEFDYEYYRVGLAVAMAKKVIHLAARRDAVHRALEAARDAIDGAYSTDIYEEDGR